MKPAAGFTLLELLIAVAVMGMLIVLVNQGVQFGLRAATLQTDLKARQGDLEAVDRALRLLIAHADPGQYPEPATLRGTADTLTLMTDLPLPEGGEPFRVAASLAAAGGRLRLRWARLRHVQPFGPPPGEQETLLAEGVTGLQIAYFAAGGAGWANAWAGEALPALVRLQLVFADGARRWPPIIAAPQREPLEQ